MGFFRRRSERVLDDLSDTLYTAEQRVVDGQTLTLARYVVSGWMATEDPDEASRMLAEKVEKAFNIAPEDTW